MYYLITNTAEHSGRIEELDESELWSNENQGGVTFQGLAGPGAAVEAEFETEKEAAAELAEWLKCPAADRGDYCYTHNPRVSLRGGRLRR